MTLLLSTSYEAGVPATDGFTVTGTGATYDTTVVKTGSQSRKWAASAAPSAVYDEFSFGTAATGRWYWVKFAFYIPSTATFTATFDTFALIINAGGTGTRVKLNSSLTPALFSSAANTQLGSVGAVLTTNAWHGAVFGYNTGAASSDDQVELYVDGTLVASAATDGGTNTSALDRVRLGFPGGPSATTETIYFDDVAINDDQGASNNTRPSSVLTSAASLIIPRRPLRGLITR